MLETAIAFGPFVFDRNSHALVREGEPVPLGGRAAALLAALLAANGGVVPKTELMESAWPNTVIEERNLTVQIAALRKALGERSDGQAWIRTVARVGYRLVRDGALPALPSRRTGTPVVAVLPFATLGDDPEQGYLADGIVEEIISALARFKSFTVIARASSFSYRNRAVDVRHIARDLGARYLLEGSVQRSADRLRINAHLIEGANGVQHWVRSFDGATANIFEFQDRIASSVAMMFESSIQIVDANLLDRRRTAPLDAYDFYLRALHKHFTGRSDDNREAYRLVNEALAIEPNYLEALALKGWIVEFRLAMGWASHDSTDREECLEIARRMLDTPASRSSALAMGIAGYCIAAHGREFDRGMQIMRAALEANPNNYFVTFGAAILALHCSTIEESLALAHRAITLSPGIPGSNWPLSAIAHAHLILGQPAVAREWAIKALAANPNFNPTYWMLIASNALLGRHDEARQWVGRLLSIAPDVSIDSIVAGQPLKDPARFATIVEGLRLAGMPEHSPVSRV
jgi:TolB-like protein